jgi:hypothetical protein
MDKPIHWRWKEEAPTVPGAILPVLSCLGVELAMGDINRPTNRLDGHCKGILDENMLAMSKVRWIDDQAVGCGQGLARAAYDTKTRVGQELAGILVTAKAGSPGMARPGGW